MGDLLPCPFCGQPPSIEMTGFHLNGRTIYCAADDCMGPHTTAANLEDATVQWNKRADADTIERLRAALHELLTNGRWTEGEQRGEWAISQGVYATAQEAVDSLNIHKPSDTQAVPALQRGEK